jgi:hypothetical protein
VSHDTRNYPPETPWPSPTANISMQELTERIDALSGAVMRLEGDLFGREQNGLEEALEEEVSAMEHGFPLSKEDLASIGIRNTEAGMVVDPMTPEIDAKLREIDAMAAKKLDDPMDAKKPDGLSWVARRVEHLGNMMMTRHEYNEYLMLRAAVSADGLLEAPGPDLINAMLAGKTGNPSSRITFFQTGEIRYDGCLAARHGEWEPDVRDDLKRYIWDLAWWIFRGRHGAPADPAPEEPDFPLPGVLPDPLCYRCRDDVAEAAKHGCCGMTTEELESIGIRNPEAPEVGDYIPPQPTPEESMWEETARLHRERADRLEAKVAALDRASDGLDREHHQRRMTEERCIRATFAASALTTILGEHAGSPRELGESIICSGEECDSTRILIAKTCWKLAETMMDNEPPLDTGLFDSPEQYPEDEEDDFAPGWRSIQQLPMEDCDEDDERCVVAWRSAENSSDIGIEITSLGCIRDGSFQSEEAEGPFYWRSLLDAPPFDLSEPEGDNVAVGDDCGTISGGESNIATNHK